MTGDNWRRRLGERALSTCALRRGRFEPTNWAEIVGIVSLESSLRDELVRDAINPSMPRLVEQAANFMLLLT
jgi:hypothetical protein